MLGWSTVGPDGSPQRVEGPIDDPEGWPILGRFGIAPTNGTDGYAWAIVDEPNTNNRIANYVLAGAQAGYSENVVVPPESEMIVERLDTNAVPGTFLWITNRDPFLTWTGIVSWVDGPVSGNPPPGYTLLDTALTIGRGNSAWTNYLPEVWFGRGIGWLIMNITNNLLNTNTLAITKQDGENWVPVDDIVVRAFDQLELGVAFHHRQAQEQEHRKGQKPEGERNRGRGAPRDDA